jgi:cytochrome c553
MRRRRVLFACVIAFTASLAGAATQPPAVVERGRPPNVRACADCHLASGLGRPDSSSLAGLPAEYIAHQIADFQQGRRTSGDARIEAMTAVANAVDTREIAAASEYFAALKRAPWIRIVERRVRSGGEQIVEVFQNEQTGYLAFVPQGSVRRGELLVEAGGGGRTVRCANCHGSDLRGTAQIPGIAGRSPSYLARQLNDMRHGLRRGLGSDRMMGTVVRLTDDDVVAIAAYAASRTP